ncbi:hypothetical protein CXG81DRAFT_28227 [Caulochytrium protostelioides]|uniref:Pre-mRNA-splicing factor SYF2 n=1 Tax=Caulochytrium protostelioides TaxID=1555241 RepID=A0A4P9X1K7_9FUNG|nr:hypothetical protein CXG81DRAFT_28227 [Caulochytrium protostelioides]|eukprot:RKO98985.1 hypothetical protein CXG81DRAFT_28227 [Caulochytrium protostelioides]
MPPPPPEACVPHNAGGGAAVSPASAASPASATAASAMPPSTVPPSVREQRMIALRTRLQATRAQNRADLYAAPVARVGGGGATAKAHERADRLRRQADALAQQLEAAQRPAQPHDAVDPSLAADRSRYVAYSMLDVERHATKQALRAAPTVVLGGTVDPVTDRLVDAGAGADAVDSDTLAARTYHRDIAALQRQGPPAPSPSRANPRDASRLMTATGAAAVSKPSKPSSASRPRGGHTQRKITDADVSAEGLERLSKHVEQKRAKRLAFRRGAGAPGVAADAVADPDVAATTTVTYINDANARFNRQLDRYYDDVAITKEMRQNLERGTAL